MKNNNLYIILAAILVVLSLVGVYYIVFLSKSAQTAYTSDVPVMTIPTDTPVPVDEFFPTETPVTPTSSSTTVTVTPKVTPTLKPSKAPITPTPTLTSDPAIPTPEYQTYENTEDGFSVTYSSSRHVYPDKESSGNRYTFYQTGANIAVHVGNSWSWSYPDRQFTDTLQISGHPTFRYDINSQTIVDVENNAKKYTLQCIHNGIAAAKTECESFLKSFKLL